MLGFDISGILLWIARPGVFGYELWLFWKVTVCYIQRSCCIQRNDLGRARLFILTESCYRIHMAFGFEILWKLHK